MSKNLANAERSVVMAEFRAWVKREYPDWKKISNREKFKAEDRFRAEHGRRVYNDGWEAPAKPAIVVGPVVGDKT